ncbi:MAG: iron-containing alcohol dehydrogenase family protein [Bryobacteraceae bacterium]
MTSFDFRPRTRILFGAGEFSRLGEVARELGGTRCLLAADRAAIDSGYAREATRSLKARRIEVWGFEDFGPDLSVTMIDAGAAFAAPLNVNLIAGLGGAISLDCARAINFVVSNGGSIRNYRGYGKAAQPMLPMVAVPTEAGMGVEAQSAASIFDPERNGRMICGDAKAVYRAAILDPKLAVLQSRALTAAAGYEAIANAVETLASTRRTPISECFSREAWRLLNANFTRVLNAPEDLDARGAMLLGAHFAGVAIENSTLAAAHACAAPLATHYNLAPGAAMGALLARVVAWNRASDYDGLNQADLAARLRDLAAAAGLPLSLRDASVPQEALPRLAEEAGAQWTGKFNPRPFNAAAALEIYQAAF